MSKLERKEVPPEIMNELWSKNQPFSPEEEEELANLTPAKELWPFPEPLPPEIEVEMPGEEEVKIIFEGYFGDAPPADWSMEKARAMVNVGRKRLWRIWEERQG